MGDKACSFDDMDKLIAAIVAEAKNGDQILVMSNGGFGGIHQKLLTQLAVLKS
jgi:UDP-N-acetylmuramate: L-alanyl-gamma-D-glutamyl-meso-diaminopimelate ligase